MKSHLTFRKFALSIILSTPADGLLAQPLTIFDTDILRARGIPASVAIYFQGGSRFSPGINHPTLVVNGNQRGTVSVRVNDQGTLCINDRFLKDAGILIPKEKKPITVQNNICPSLPLGIDAKLQPGRNRIELLVPPQLIDNNRESEKISYVSGGSAALLNYNLYITGNYGLHYRSHNVYAHTESGFNFDNWIVRSYDSYSSQGENAKFQHQSAWVQRTYPSFKSTMQVGQLTLNSPLFSAPAFNGIQVIPESVLLNTNNGVRVTGIAHSAARVEVHQGGILIHSTLVPSGIFVLNNLSLNNFSQNLEVTVIENSGERQKIIVPSASFGSNLIPLQQGWTFAIGQPRDTGSDDNNLKSQGFITATFPIKTMHANITTGLMLADRYTSAGINAKTSFWNGASSYVRLLAAKDSRTDTQGVITQAGHSMALWDTILANFSASFYTFGFRYLTDIPQLNISRHSLQRRLYNANLGWKNEMLGYFSLGLARSERFDNTAENYPTLSWKRNIGLASLSLSVLPRTGEYSDNMYYFHVTLPMGKGHTNFSASKEGNYTRATASINQQINDTFGYSVGTSTTNKQHYDFNSSFNLKARYASLYGNYSYNGHDNHSWSANINGSIMHDGHSMLFSPYSMRDTFGIVSVTGIDNMRIQTPIGMVRTNSTGRAIVPSLTPYSQSSIDLITNGLPRNMEIINSRAITKSGRGSVSYLNLKVEQHRKILLQVTDPNGNSFRQGVAVLDRKDRYLTIIGSDSDIYLDKTQINEGLLIEDENGRRCILDFTVNTKPPKNDEPYEIIPAVCR
ncbi:MAG: fimbria/pilus outer membrane usher protein [Arsenophonus sp.]